MNMMNQKGFNFIALLIPVVIMAVVTFFYLRSPESLPPDKLYFIKEFREAIFLSTKSLNYENLVDANIILANERVKEVVKLVEMQSEGEIIRETLVRLNNNQSKALDYTLRIKARGSFVPEYFEKVENAFIEHQKVLSNLYYYLPHSLYDDLDQALKITNELLEKERANR